MRGLSATLTIVAGLLAAMLAFAPASAQQGADPLAVAMAHTAAASAITTRMRNAANRGQLERLDPLARDYAAAIASAMRGIEIAQGQGQSITNALAAVEQATSTHGTILGGLLGQVPEQARPAIAHALEVSQRGRETALSRLGGLQQGPGGLGRGPGGPPSGIGGPRGRGGPPSGIGGYRSRGGPLGSIGGSRGRGGSGRRGR